MTKEEQAELVRQVAEDGYHHPHLEVHTHMALSLLEKLIEENEKTHEPFDWKELEVKGNVSRAAVHHNGMNLTTGNNYTPTDASADHLLHACCRLLFAIQLREEERNRGR